MNSKKATRLLLFSAAVALFGQTIYGQNVFIPTVPASSVPEGYYRPHSWILGSADPAIAPSIVHGPGQSCTSPTCYYFPNDIRTAYATAFIANGNGGAGMTVGIVDAYYNSQTEADLASFNAFFGLPACTIASGCLTIVSQTGGAPSAGFNAGWSQETDLDVQWVHAIAPKAKILLVTGNSSSFADMGAAVTYASAHSDVVSNSYGANEFAGETTFDSIYSGSTVPVMFSSGDAGAVSQYPCASQYATCVGGTRLLETASSYRNVESAWSGSGGGCSSQVASVAYQAGFSTCGAVRGVPDIAALADPNTGAIVYLGTNAGVGTPGYYVFGGTSLACPITAALVANIDTARVTAGKSKLGSNLNPLVYGSVAAPYYHYRFYDVLTGTSGFPAVAGWDRATGLGVPLSPALSNYLVSLP